MTIERYNWLIKTEIILDALKCTGIDEWEGCSYVFEGYEAPELEEEFEDDLEIKKIIIL